MLAFNNGLLMRGRAARNTAQPKAAIRDLALGDPAIAIDDGQTNCNFMMVSRGRPALVSSSYACMFDIYTYFAPGEPQPRRGWTLKLIMRRSGAASASGHDGVVICS